MGKKSLQIQSSYDSALILSLHCTSLSIIVLSQPLPAHLSHKRYLKPPAWLWMPLGVFHKEEGIAARRHLEAHPALELRLGRSHSSSYSPLLGCRLVKIGHKDTLNSWWLCSFWKGATGFPCTSLLDGEHPEFTARVSELKSTCLLSLGVFVLILKPSLTNTPESENQVWATLLCAYLNCCPTYGICLNTWFGNPTKVQLF